MLALYGRYYEDYKVGEKHITPSRTITESDLVSFACLTTDWSPLHTDEEWAKESIFKKRIAHGMLTFSFGRGLIDRLGPHGPGSGALLGFTDVHFISPVFIGDTIHVEAEVSEVKLSKKGRGIVIVKCEVYNQRKEKVAYWQEVLSAKKMSEE